MLAVYDKKLNLSVYSPKDGMLMFTFENLDCYIGEKYLGRTQSPNFNANVGVSVYFSLTAEQRRRIHEWLTHDDTRIQACLTDRSDCYEINGMEDYDDYYKCPATKCRWHGDRWT